MIPSQINPCIYYTVRINPDTKTPILGTMQSRAANHHITDPCLEAAVPATQMTHTNQCWPSTGLRYWYKVSKIDGEVLANSMFTSVGKVDNQCSGQYNILEFVIYSA